MKRFGVLLYKELRELLTPQTLVPIVLIVLVFLGLGRVISQQSKIQAQPQPVMVVDQDHTQASAAVSKLLEKDNLKITAADAIPDFTNPVSQKAVIVIPAGFQADMAAGKPAQLQTYTIQNGFSVAKLADTALVSTAVAQINATLAAEHIAALAPKKNPVDVLAPVQAQEHLVVAGKVAQIDPTKVASYLGSQFGLVPVVLFIVIVFAGQMVATAMANEKENKTLETLLSVPISRNTIVAAKMVAAGIVASLMASAYVYGLHSIQSTFTGGQTVDDATKAALSQLGLTLTPTSYALLALSLFLGILAALAIALVLGAFADNIKSAQTLTMPLMILLLIPYMASLLVDVQTLPKTYQLVLAAIPFTYTFQAMPNLYAHNYGQVIFGAVYVFAFFVVFMMIAAKLFASDKILTLRLKFKR
jgi:ABC-2 type transport system permease protein